MPDRIAPVEYDQHEIVRTVSHNGWVRFRGRRWRVGEAFRGERVVAMVRFAFPKLFPLFGLPTELPDTL